MMFKQRLFKSWPGMLNHQIQVATEARTNSTYMPPAPMAARAHLLGNSQESDTLQYRQGVSTRTITPISWHSPPKCLHIMPWPNSCSTLVTPSVQDSKRAFSKLKNS